MDDRTAMQQKIETEIENLISKTDFSISEVDDFVDKNKGDYPEDLGEFAFRVAVRLGNMTYVQEHVDDIELNDAFEYSTYLNETEDNVMQNFLINHGAFRDMEEYGDYKFAMETVNGEILAFKEDFQKQVFKKYKKEFELTNKSIAEILDGDADNETDRDIEEDLSLLGVSIENGKANFEDKCGEEGYDLMELLEELGYDCDFEGDSWKLETAGVYFIE